MSGCTGRIQSGSGDTDECGNTPTVGDSKQCAECLRGHLRWVKSNSEKAIAHLKSQQDEYDAHKAALDAHDAARWTEEFINLQTHRLVARWVNDRFEAIRETYSEAYKMPPVYDSEERQRLAKSLFESARATVMRMSKAEAL